MNVRRPEMADIVRTHQSEFLQRWNHVLSREQRKALRRFLLHVLPTGLVRIRQFGFLANCVRAPQLPLCRALLAARFPPPCDPTAPASPDSQACPNCERGRLSVIETFRAGPCSFPDTS